jgi:Flp pilus assembly protein TadD
VAAFNLAALLDERGRIDDAEPLYEHAARHGEPRSRIVLALLAAERGRLAKARDHLRVAHDSRDSEVSRNAAAVAQDLNISVHD